MGNIPSIIWSVYACLDVITSEKERKVNKDYKTNIVKVKKPKRRKKRGHGWSQKGSKDTRRTKPLKRIVDPDYSEKTFLKVKKPKRRKKRGHGWSKKGSKDSRRRKSLFLHRSYWGSGNKTENLSSC